MKTGIDYRMKSPDGSIILYKINEKDEKKIIPEEADYAKVSRDEAGNLNYVKFYSNNGTSASRLRIINRLRTSSETEKIIGRLEGTL